MNTKTLEYTYKHTQTEATTGYFSCEPPASMNLEQCLDYLCAAPLDDFMHRKVLQELMGKSLMELRRFWEAACEEASCADNKKAIVKTLLAQCAILHTLHAELLQEIDMTEVYENHSDFTPLPYIAWRTQQDRDLHSTWSKFFVANITEHEKLPHPEEMDDEDLRPLYTAHDMESLEKNVPLSLHELHIRYQETPGIAWSRPEAQDTAQRALQLLLENGVLNGVEMRHEASLSPIALQRAWSLKTQVENGRNNFILEGEATTYGRGLSLAQTRASYAMEMIERASAYPSVKDHKILERDGSITLYHARYSELVQQGHNVLDPNNLPLDAPYADAPLYWLEARCAPISVKENCDDTIFVPAQFVFLFSNLDEVSLLMQPSSTGLASGNSLAEAKVAALTEIIERDAEATMPYDRRRCFVLKARDERIAGLLEDYESRGIHVHFLDITTEFGIPCYQAFVLDKKGRVIRATGAGLSGQKAVLAALTEVPYAYPHGPQSGPAIKGLEERILEDLPDYTLESPTRNLALMEEILHLHGYLPSYVDITQRDLEMPVVRALIPGLLLGSEMDRFTRISKRLYRNYLRMYEKA